VTVAATLAVAVGLRFVARSDLWLDEALSVNIATLPLGALRAALERDGSPPLYYVLLHGWIALFGDSDVAVRAMSGVLSLLTLPALFLSGRRIAGSAGARSALLLGATLPFALRYATEARMYALVMFLVAWGLVFTMRALDDPRPHYLALVALVVGALLYTQTWSFYLLAAAAGAVAVPAWRAASLAARSAARRVLAAMVVGALLFVPWLPTFLSQLRHTGTPWGDARVPWAALASAVGALGGVQRPTHAEAVVMAAVLVALFLLGLLGAAAGPRTIELDLRTRRPVRAEGAVGLATLGIGLTLSYVVGTAFEPRYTAVAVPLLTLVAARGITTFPERRLRAGVLGFVVLLGLAGGIRSAIDERTQAGSVAATLRERTRAGDVVVYCPDQVGPSVQRVLGERAGVDEVTFPDLAGPRFVDWVDYRDRIAESDVDDFARRVLARAGDGTVWYVVASGYHSLDGKCEELGGALTRQRPNATSHVVQDPLEYFESIGLTELRPR
jgi:mannosyltransferase